MHPFAYHEFKEIDVEENRSFVTKAIIKKGFVDLGIKKGDALFVHCSTHIVKLIATFLPNELQMVSSSLSTFLALN